MFGKPMLGWLFKIMLGLSLILTVLNIRDEGRGQTIVHLVGMSGASYAQYRASKSDDESRFRGAMLINWFYAVGSGVLGGLGLALLRRSDRLDPLSPHFRYPEDDDSSSR